jgi:hypothetical protein
MEAHPGAVEAQKIVACRLSMEKWRLSMEKWRLSMEKWRLSMEKWRLTMEPRRGLKACCCRFASL